MICDAGFEGKACSVEPTWECACPRCLREPDPEERFHACHQHRELVATAHLRVRGRLPIWVAYRSECDCPGCKADLGCFRK